MSREKAAQHAAMAEDLLTGHRSQGGWVGEHMTDEEIASRAAAHAALAAYYASTADPSEPPLIDGCRIITRGDGNYVCKVHYRHWPVGSGMCPGRRAPIFYGLEVAS